MTTDSTTIKFVNPVLTKFPVNVAPTYETLKTLQTELNANALGIRSSEGGIFGHIVLTMSPDQYLLLTNNVVFNEPINPGDNPTHLPGATQQEVTETNRAHLVAKSNYEKYHDTDNALKTLLLAACPDLYLEPLKQPFIGYGGRTTLDLLAHLWVSYGKIEPSQLIENENRMKAPWHPTEPIEKLFSQLKTTYEFALFGNAGITEITVVRCGYKIISDTGLFKIELREWRAKPDADLTLVNFYAFFKAANIDRLATTTDGGFHNGNVTSTPNLAATAATDEIAALKLQVAQLTKLVKTKTKRNPPTVPNDGTPPATTYCWTHGTSKNIQHTSKTCKFKATGHKEDATEENKMGGSTKIWTSPITPKE